MFWTVVLITILGTVIWFGNGIRKIGAVSAGDPIQTRSETALLLIDLQTAFWDAALTLKQRNPKPRSAFWLKWRPQRQEECP